MRSYRYTIAFKRSQFAEVEHIDVTEQSKERAYDIAVNYLLPIFNQINPFSAWVESVTYHDGTKRIFNTFEGKRF